MLGSSHAAAAARSKLQLASGSGPRDNGSLHRWVLLKNSLLNSLSPALAVVQPSTTPPASPVTPEPGSTFVFPDPSPPKHAQAEAQWFDNLLDELEHEDEDEEDDCYACAVDAEQPLPALPDSDGEDLDEFEPVYGPATSDEDLLAPRPRPVYTYAPPLLASSSYAYPPLPYPPLSLDDDEPPVPDAVPDDSDDESDAPSTPSLLRSSASSSSRAPVAVTIALVDAYHEDDDAFGFDESYFFAERATAGDPAQEC